jgi:hypothetical protein
MLLDVVGWLTGPEQMVSFYIRSWTSCKPLNLASELRLVSWCLSFFIYFYTFYVVCEYALAT